MNSQSLYKALIAPRSGDSSTQNQEIVLNWLLVGSICLSALAFVVDLFSLTVMREAYILPRLLVIVCVLLFFGSLLFLSRRSQWRILPAVVLVGLFFVAAAAVVGLWGILVPTGILLFSLVIVMSGVLLGASYSLYAALLAFLTLSAAELAKVHGLLRPDLAWQSQPSNFSDIAGFAAVYAVIALVSWLFNGQMEAALRRAQRSEKALKRQRDLLEVKVEERTRELKAAQAEQIQQLYRFAELGHLSTALFHDLANHLASVSVDIEGLRQKRQSDMLGRIKDNINYIDDVVKRVRQQVQGNTRAERFDVAEEVREIIKILSYHSAKAKVAIDLTAPEKPVVLKGDLTRFRQLIINLLNNGIEAYKDVRPSGKEGATVTITLEKAGENVRITVTDHGKGIPRDDQPKIFEPFYSTKKLGLGIGLFIVKQVTEKDFGGSINLTSEPGATDFVITLPPRRHGSRTARG